MILNFSTLDVHCVLEYCIVLWIIKLLNYESKSKLSTLQTGGFVKPITSRTREVYERNKNLT